MDLITLSVLLLLRLFLIGLFYAHLRLGHAFGPLLWASLNINFCRLYAWALHVVYLSHFLF